MKRSRIKVASYGFAVWGGLSALMILPAHAQLVAIVNKTVHISHSEVVRIYRSEMNGYKPFMLGDKAAQDDFDRHYLGLAREDLKYLQDRALYAGRSLPPKIVDSVDEMLDAVANTPNGVGYVPLQNVTEQVRVVPENQDGSGNTWR